MPQKYIPGEVFLPENSVVPEKIRLRNKLISDAEDLYGTELDETDRDILSTSPARLVEGLKQDNPRFTCQRVLQAYIKAACIAHRTHNVLTEVLFVQAMEDAKQHDKERAAGQTCEGPFWGLPSSFKDTYNIVGVDSSLGCSPHCGKPTQDHEDEGGLVKLFRKGGGIPFCKTNVPQTLLAFECGNPVFGPSSNPFDTARVPGGSSGGEAALVALRGTPIGWGSDIGGSLRIPAHYSGICGLKPVRARWPIGTTRKSVPGFEAVKSAVGPMARDVEDLTWASRGITELALGEYHRGADAAPPVPWTDEPLPAKLRVGWFTEFGGVRSSPACKRAVKIAVDRLTQAGHTVEEFALPDPLEGFKVFVALTSADGYETLFGNLGKDPMEPSMRLVTLGSRIPSILKTLAVWVIRRIVGDGVFASIFETSGKKTVKDFLAWTDRRDVWAAKFNREAWSKRNFDMVICPVQATPALQHGETEFLSPLANATITFNICDSTVGTLPITRVDRTLDAWTSSSLEHHHPPSSQLLEKRVYGEKGVYNANAMHGLPVGIQVVGRAYEEEKVLKMMKVVEDVVQYEASF